MQKVTLIRGPSTDEGTFGLLKTEPGDVFHTGELPWRDNDHGTSCIPPGVYICKLINSPKHGMCYQVMSVPGRDMIEIHSANWMGDKSLGLKSQLLGCIALGKSIGMLEGQTAVIGSRAAIDEFNDAMGAQDFELTIKEQA